MVMKLVGLLSPQARWRAAWKIAFRPSRRALEWVEYQR